MFKRAHATAIVLELQAYGRRRPRCPLPAQTSSPAPSEKQVVSPGSNPVLLQAATGGSLDHGSADGTKEKGDKTQEPRRGELIVRTPIIPSD